MRLSVSALPLSFTHNTIIPLSCVSVIHAFFSRRVFVNIRDEFFQKPVYENIIRAELKIKSPDSQNNADVALRK